MFQRNEFGIGGAGATLTLAAGLRAPAAAAPVFGRKAAHWIEDLDLVVDLGARIGSREWWRGAATCAALCATTILLSPGFQSIPAAAPAPLAEAQWDEARTIGIAPAAFGADTGRRMAATDAVQPLVDTPERPSIDLAATLGRGDGFARVLERSGVARAEAVAIADMVRGTTDIDAIKPGTRIGITLGRRPNRNVARPLDALSFRARFDLQLAVERIGGRLKLVPTPIAVDETPLRIQGRVGSSLFRSARAAGAPAKAVETYLRAIAQRMSVSRDVRSDDRFDIIVEHRRAATGEVEVGQLLYAGLDQGRKQTRMLKWTLGGREQWFEASGVGERKGIMRAPVIGRLTSGFGLRRHPVLGFSRFHKGLDFGAAYGSPIVAATDGTVVFAGRHGGHGNYVKLSHSGGLATAYAHMSRIVAQPGQRVSQGQVIGYVGSTGLSTGPHLHYEVYRNNVAINPKSISFISTALLAGAELQQFKAKLNRLLAVPLGANRTATAKKDDKPAA
ncbi:M23 family metallopeptidase [Sphingomonas sp. 1P06PA]|uniref:M23 family metallopeptidase n=1 Tax=Sphingomonas sp. 1P06PA TaxID=554121 RepID=UPI0039A54F83